MRTLIQDLRYSFRVLLKSRMFSAIAIITLALGIGANTAIFSLVNAVLLRNLPVKHPEQLVAIGNASRTGGLSQGSPRSDLLSYPLYSQLAPASDVFDGMAASGRFSRVMFGLDSLAAHAEKIRGRMVTSNYFAVLGLNALVGRVFEPEAVEIPGSEPQAVISYSFWERKFSRDPNIIGRTVYINGYPLTLIGVAPASYTGEVVGQITDIWVPVNMQPEVMPGRHYLKDASVSWLLGIARLKHGVTVEQARTRLNLNFQQVAHSSFARQFDTDDQAELAKLKIPVSYGGHGLSYFRAQFQEPLIILMVVVGLVLLITCFNVANLLLARSSARQKEIAVRIAIGASAWRLVRQLLTESLALASIGGIFGLVLATWGTRLLLQLVTYRGATHEILDVSPDLMVLAFTAAVSILTGIVFGSAPALRWRRVELTPALKQSTLAAPGSQSHSRFPAGKLMVAGQVALSILVVFVAGLLVVSLRNLQRVGVGYDRDRLLNVRIDLVAAGLTGQRALTFCDQLVDKLKSTPGVRAASISENGLFSGTESAAAIIVEGFHPKSDSDRDTYYDDVGPDYFKTVGIPLLLGRDISGADTLASPKVAVVNQTFVSFYFGDRNPIGHKLYIDDEKLRAIPIEIVGVARDARENDIRGEIKRRFYIATAQLPSASAGVDQPAMPPELNLVIRATGDTASIAQSVRRVIAQVNPSVPIVDFDKVKDLVTDELTQENAVAKLCAFFAGLVLLLACIGLYGITSYSVAGRTREIGVRMASGAQTTDVLWLVLRDALMLVGAGIAAGLPVALFASRVMGTLLFGVSAANPALLITPVVMLAAVGLLAAFIPARRATRVDPLVALRYE